MENQNEPEDLETVRQSIRVTIERIFLEKLTTFERRSGFVNVVVKYPHMYGFAALRDVLTRLATEPTEQEIASGAAKDARLLLNRLTT